MLSILIPTYNHNVYPLVSALDGELQIMDIVYEIVVFDDNSTMSLPHNEKITAFHNTQLHKLPKNIGRSAIRHALAMHANYNILLFLDADVMPVSNSFIATYVQHILQEQPEVIYGGVAYQSEAPPAKERLRWEYGRNREVQSVAKRKKQPHFIITQNVLIRKETFLSLSIPKENFYGDDLVFSQQLKKKKVRVSHIHNPVLHLGLESSDEYFKKALAAVTSIVELEKTGMLDTNLTKLQQTYIKLKKWRATGIFKFFMAPKKHKMKQNFLSSKPNLKWFDVYRLLYYIEIKSEANA